MTPEDEARQRIDEQLAKCGWLVQDHGQMDITAGSGVAVRQFPLTTGEADYLLYADAKCIGVIEAKREGYPLKGVETQSDKYVNGLPKGLPHYRLPLPFAYESTGTVTQFTNGLNPDARSREVFTFHRPEELIRLVGLEHQVRALLRRMPEIKAGRLWRVQLEAIDKLEQSLAQNRARSLIQMATGSGKTFTAVSFCYRIIKFAKAKRILFLVDRNNLGRQTLKEYQQFQSADSGYKFTEEYSVQHLKRNAIDPACKVCITTIQRLYSMLKGEEEFLDENEEDSLFETDTPLIKKPMPVVYNPKIPIEAFDFIVVDECHRSIYNVWRQVLEYFDAFIIGLTATPTAQTIGFFQRNLVQDYTHEEAVVDGVNVGFDVYRIQTKITKGGAKLAAQPRVFVPHRNRRTKNRTYKELDDDLTYTAQELDRDVVAEDQIRLVLKTFKDNLPEMFPGRTEVPKTLVFAKSDLHAEDIVRIMREEFGKGNDFCQKITSKTTGRKPEELLAEFRNSYNPRIAVTVDMIATGTDVKPLECLLFMRNIKSLSYFEQMKGRGVRVIDSDDLRGVTPDARHKTRFMIVDAVGVCEEPKSPTRPLDRKPSVPLEKLLALAAAGASDPDLVSTLASRLARLQGQLDEQARKDIAKASDGRDLGSFAGELLRSIDLDEVVSQATREFAEPTDKQVKEVEHKRMQAALKPFHKPKLRDAILRAKQSLEQVIDEQSRDELDWAGFDEAAREKAGEMLASFREFIEEHKSEIEALTILYSRPYRAGLRFSQVKELAARIERAPQRFNPERLWQAYEAIEPMKVRGHGGRALVDVIALVRHAIDPETVLEPVRDTVEERYKEWLSDQAEAGMTFTEEQVNWLEAIKDHIAGSLAIDSEDLEGVPFNQIGGLGRAHELFGERLRPILEELNTRLAA